VLLIDRVPQAQLGGDAIVEPVEDRQAVAALGRGGEPEQLGRREWFEHLLVRRCGGVVELVDDHHVEVIAGQRVEVGRVEALDRREDVLEARRPGTADPLLAERRVAEARSGTSRALVEDLLAVRDEQQARAIETLRAGRRSRGPPSPSCRCRWPRRAGCGGGPAAGTPRAVRGASPGRGAGAARSGSGSPCGPESVRPARSCSSTNCAAS
jgi:hypothetical protein